MSLEIPPGNVEILEYFPHNILNGARDENIPAKFI